MEAVFYVSGAVALIATVMVITRTNPVHALLYLVVSLLAVALVFASLGAPFVAALEVIIYAGAIVVLFLFAVMLLDLGGTGGAGGGAAAGRARRRPAARAWIGPALLAVVLLVELGFLVTSGSGDVAAGVGARQVGRVLYGPYAIGVELASLLLFVALVGARHLGARRPEEQDEEAEWPADAAGDPWEETW